MLPWPAPKNEFKTRAKGVEVAKCEAVGQATRGLTGDLL